ncbi:hypothetical protein [Bifidobacterium merycicum]|uniref:hypothetical protein n=1 Tax=Bifidobacterium merycicum TaxID=78345 RepID=UPI000ADF21AC|nr:hypothetical protein [Bifidobacterium merycicum]MBQ1513800.1 hypothetical protein [Bifidobacterium sp.]
MSNIVDDSHHHATRHQGNALTSPYLSPNDVPPPGRPASAQRATHNTYAASYRDHGRITILNYHIVREPSHCP